MPHLFDSLVIPLFKGKGDWTLKKSWRPIAMPNAAYRILLRLLTAHFSTFLSSCLHPNQYGARGRSTAGATHHLISQAVQSGAEAMACLLDMSNAFGSLPNDLIHSLLQRNNLPPCH